MKRGQAIFQGTFLGQKVEECRVVVFLMKDGSTAVTPIEHVVGMTGQVSAKNMSIVGIRYVKREQGRKKK